MNDDSIPLDHYSMQILLELQRDARQTVQQIADKIGLSSTPCWRRIKEMEVALENSVEKYIQKRNDQAKKIDVLRELRCQAEIAASSLNLGTLNIPYIHIPLDRYR